MNDFWFQLPYWVSWCGLLSVVVLMVVLPRSQWRARLLSWLGLVFGLLLLGWFVYMLDGPVAFTPRSWAFLLTIFVLAALLTMPLAWQQRSWRMGAVGLAFCLGVLGLHFSDHTPRKPFLRAYLAVQPGMTEAEVLDTLHREFPEGGKYPFPRRLPIYADWPNQMGFQLSETDGRFNAEIIFVTMANGRVADKRYSFD